MICSQHPKYKGLRAPRTQCSTCLNYYNTHNVVAVQSLAESVKAFLDAVRVYESLETIETVARARDMVHKLGPALLDYSARCFSHYREQIAQDTN